MSVDTRPIRARLAAATEGDWQRGEEGSAWPLVHASGVVVADCGLEGILTAAQCEANAELIANARNHDLAALCDEVEALRAENALLREREAELHGQLMRMIDRWEEQRAALEPQP